MTSEFMEIFRELPANKTLNDILFGKTDIFAPPKPKKYEDYLREYKIEVEVSEVLAAMTDKRATVKQSGDTVVIDYLYDIGSPQVAMKTLVRSIKADMRQLVDEARQKIVVEIKEHLTSSQPEPLYITHIKFEQRSKPTLTINNTEITFDSSNVKTVNVAKALFGRKRNLAGTFSDEQIYE